MLSDEQLEAYRRMTPGERYRLSFELFQFAWTGLMDGTKENVDRKFWLLNRENDLRNANMASALSRLGPHSVEQS